MAEYRRGSHTVYDLQYWGQHLWARGYFCVSVGEATSEQIQEYIEKHQEEPPSTFRTS